MFQARFRGRVRDVIAIKGERTQLIAVVLTRDCENRKRDLFELLGSRDHRVVISIRCRMLQNALEIHRWISNERIKRMKRDVLLIGIQKFRTPEFLIAKKIALTSVTAGEGEPLHIVSLADVIE